LADGGITFNFPDGVTLTAPAGWTVINSMQTGVWVRNSDNSAAAWVSSGSPHASDIKADMAWLINSETTANGYTIEAQNPRPLLAVQARNFTQCLITGYIANAQTDQGTMRFYGL
jgi:hypothetical protein